MFRKTTLAAGLILAAPLVAVAQEPTWKWVDATYNENRPVTRMAAPQDLNDPNVIALSSANGTATPQSEIRQVSAVQPISTQVATDHSVLYSNPSHATAYQATAAPQTIVYDNPQPIAQRTIVQQPVIQQPVAQQQAYPVTTSYYVQPVEPNPWYTTGNVQVVQRAQYAAAPVTAAPLTVNPATCAAPVTTVARPVTTVGYPVTTVGYPVSTVAAPVTVQRPTVVYNNPPVMAPIGAPVIAAPTVVPAATVYPVDRTAYRPVLPVIGMNNNSFVGRGLLGQPEVYTEGQPLRNVLRYLLP